MRIEAQQTDLADYMTSMNKDSTEDLLDWVSFHHKEVVDYLKQMSETLQTVDATKALTENASAVEQLNQINVKFEAFINNVFDFSRTLYNFLATILPKRAQNYLPSEVVFMAVGNFLDLLEQADFEVFELIPMQIDGVRKALNSPNFAQVMQKDPYAMPRLLKFNQTLETYLDTLKTFHDDLMFFRVVT